MGMIDKIKKQEDVSLDFSPVPSLARLFTEGADKKFMFLMGPIGSTKTTTCLYYLLMSAANQAPSPDGIRRTRFGIIRYTLSSLRMTILKDTLSLFGEIASWNGSNNTLTFKIADIHSEWIFLPLETLEDQRRLLSLQLTSIYINEAREIDFTLMMTAFSRTGRFPSNKHGGVEVTHRFLLADSNMGTKNSELYKFLEEEKHDAVLFVHQPSGLSPQADWLQFLPKNYYEDVQIGQTKAWIDTHVHSKWSLDLTGLPIFADVFNENWHVSKSHLKTIHGYPIIIGIDPGFNPAALFCQLSPRGQLRVYREVYAPNCLFGHFISNYIMPIAALSEFALKPLMFVMDPAGINRNAVTGLSAYGVLEEMKLSVNLASTNDVDPRLKGIERLLVESRGFESNDPHARQIPAMIIDPRCEVLIRALAGEYRFKKRKLTGELEDKPEKKHPISDVTDALGYVALGLGTSSIVENFGPTALLGQNKSIYKPPPDRAWT